MQEWSVDALKCIIGAIWQATQAQPFKSCEVAEMNHPAVGKAATSHQVEVLLKIEILILQKRDQLIGIPQD